MAWARVGSMGGWSTRTLGGGVPCLEFRSYTLGDEYGGWGVGDPGGRGCTTRLNFLSMNRRIIFFFFLLFFFCGFCGVWRVVVWAVVSFLDKIVNATRFVDLDRIFL